MFVNWFYLKISLTNQVEEIEGWCISTDDKAQQNDQLETEQPERPTKGVTYLRISNIKSFPPGLQDSVKVGDVIMAFFGYINFACLRRLVYLNEHSQAENLRR